MSASLPASVHSLRAAVCVVALCVAPSRALAQAHRPPTPHESIDRAVAPVRAAIDAAHATDAERDALRDVVARAERWAAELVEAQHRHDLGAIRDRTRWIAALARVVAARVEAMRAEAQADDAERRAAEAEGALARREGAAP